MDEWLLIDLEGMQGWVVRCGMTLTDNVANVPVVGGEEILSGEHIVSASETEDLDRLPSFVSIRAPT